MNPNHINLQAVAKQVMLQYGFEPDFPAAALQQMAQLKANPPHIAAGGGIRDLRDLLHERIAQIVILFALGTQAFAIKGDAGLFHAPEVLGGVALLAFYLLAWRLFRRPRHGSARARASRLRRRLRRCRQLH